MSGWSWVKQRGKTSWNAAELQYKPYGSAKISSSTPPWHLCRVETKQKRKIFCRSYWSTFCQSPSFLPFKWAGSGLGYAPIRVEITAGKLGAARVAYCSVRLGFVIDKAQVGTLLLQNCVAAVSDQTNVWWVGHPASEVWREISGGTELNWSGLLAGAWQKSEENKFGQFGLKFADEISAGPKWKKVRHNCAPRRLCYSEGQGRTEETTPSDRRRIEGNRVISAGLINTSGVAYQVSLA